MCTRAYSTQASYARTFVDLTVMESFLQQTGCGLRLIELEDEASELGKTKVDENENTSFSQKSRALLGHSAYSKQ
jgi:hypothetical protein